MDFFQPDAVPEPVKTSAAKRPRKPRPSRAKKAKVETPDNVFVVQRQYEPSEEELTTLNCRAYGFCTSSEQWQVVRQKTFQDLKTWVEEMVFQRDRKLYDTVFNFTHDMYAKAFDFALGKNQGCIYAELKNDLTLRSCIEEEGKTMASFLTNRMQMLAVTIIDCINGRMLVKNPQDFKAPGTTHDVATVEEEQQQHQRQQSEKDSSTRYNPQAQAGVQTTSTNTAPVQQPQAEVHQQAPLEEKDPYTTTSGGGDRAPPPVGSYAHNRSLQQQRSGSVYLSDDWPEGLGEEHSLSEDSSFDITF